VAEFDQRGQHVGNQFNFAVTHSQVDRFDARLVGRWECVAFAGSDAGAVQGPWGLSGSHFAYFGADGRGRTDFARWRASAKLASGKRIVLSFDGMREFIYSADGVSYQEIPEPFVGNVGCKVGGFQSKAAEATWRSPQRINCNYTITGGMLILHSDTWRKDFRRCGPG